VARQRRCGSGLRPAFALLCEPVFRLAALARTVVAAAFVLTFSLSHAARAESQTFSIEWTAPPTCPPSTFVLSEMERLLGRPPGLPSDRPVSVGARVASAGSTYTVHIVLTTSGGRGERTFHNASCERVALATALVASLAVDPEAVNTTEATPPSSVSPIEPRPSPPATGLALPNTAREQTASPPRKRWFVAGIEAGGHLGILPHTGKRLAAVAGVSWRSLRLELVGGYDFAEDARPLELATRGAHLQLNTLKLRACLAVLDGAIELDTCASVESGLFFAEGFGIAAPANKVYPWVALLAGVRLAWRFLDPLEARLGLEGGPSLLRPDFEITGASPTFVYHPSRFIGQGTVGLVVRFL
jgi:hypothetical protein